MTKAEFQKREHILLKELRKIEAEKAEAYSRVKALQWENHLLEHDVETVTRFNTFAKLNEDILCFLNPVCKDLLLVTTAISLRALD